MKLLDLLAKLGIVRYGATAATYRSGADRPSELQMGDVLDAKRDLTTRDDIKDILGKKGPKKAAGCCD